MVNGLVVVEQIPERAHDEDGDHEVARELPREDHLDLLLGHDCALLERPSALV
jgi:hypothetical protein